MRRKYRKLTSRLIAIFILIFLIAFLGYFGFMVKLSGYTVTSLDRNVSEVDIGDAIQVNISIQDITNLSGIQIDVIYNPSILEYIGTEEGTFLSENGLISTYFNESEINVTSGNLDDIVIFRQGEVDGVTGNGTLAIIYFNATGSGTSYLNLTEVLLSDPVGGSLLSTMANTTITVSGIADIINPVISLNEPVDVFNTTSQTIVFNATAYDNINLTNLSIYGNWTGSWILNTTNLTPLNNTLTNFNIAAIPEGYHKWNVYACDNSGNCAFAASNRTFTVNLTVLDSINPTVTLNTPVNYYNTTSQTIVFNATAYDNIRVASMTLYSNFSGSWTSNVTNSSPANNTLTNFSVIGIPEGYYRWNVYSCDNSSNCAFATSNRTFTIDLTAPTITINAPSGTISTNNVTVNISFSDNFALNYCSYNITNSVGGTVVADNSITCGLSSIEYQTIVDGSNYVITTFANDTLGNLNITSQTFSVNTAAPVLLGGGGGGGSTVTTSGGDTFTLSADQISLKLKKGETQKASFIINNTGLATLDLDINSSFSFFNISDRISLAPAESKTIEFDVFVHLDTIPDLYIGKIYITSEGSITELLVSVEVISDKIFILAEINLPLKYTYTSPGEKIKADITLTRIKELTEGNLLNLTYIVLNEPGETILRESEVKEMGELLKYSKEFRLSKELPYGRYALYVQAEYGGEVSSSTRWFSLQKPGFFLILKRNIIWVLTIFIFIDVLLLLLIKYLKKRKNLSYSKENFGESSG